jgi:hypothetical protein
MIKAVYLADLSNFTTFHYYPMLESEPGCFEPVRKQIKVGDVYPQYTVYGVRLVLDPPPKKTLYEKIFGGRMPAQPRPVEEAVADLEDMGEAINFCRMLMARLEGRAA